MAQTASDIVSSSAVSATASTTSEDSITASSVSSNAGSTSSSAASETDSGSSAISMSSSSSISSAELAITGTTSLIDVSVTSTDSATATDSAATSSATSTIVDDISFLVQRGVKYSGTPLTGLTKRRVANDLITCLSTCAGSSACAVTSFNLENLSCDYFSAIDQSSMSPDAAMIFAIATSRVAIQSSSAISSESIVISGSSSMASSPSGTGSTTSDASTSSESTPAPSYTDETNASATQSSSAASTTVSTNYQSDSSSSASSTSTDASSTGDGDINTSSATQSESTSSASITETASVAADDGATSLSSASTSLTSSTSGSEEPQITATPSSTESAIATETPVAEFQNVRILATGSGTTVDGTALQVRNSVSGFGLGGDDFKLTIDKFGNLKDSAGRFQAIKLNSRFLPYWTQSGPLVSQQNWGAPDYATISNCGVGLDMIITCRLAVPYGTHSMTFFLIRRPQGFELYAGRNDGSHRDVRLQIDVSRPSSTPSTVSTSTSSSAGISVTSSSSEIGSMTSSASSVDGESMVTSASSSDESGSATISSDQGSATFSPTVTDPATSSADSASSSSEVSSTSTSVSETISTTDSSTSSEQVTATSSSVGSSITGSPTAAAIPTCGTVVPYSWPGSASVPSNACRSTYTDVSSNINSYNIKCNIDYNGADILITRGNHLSPTPSASASSSAPSSTPAGPTLPPVPTPTPIYVTPRSGSRLYANGGIFDGDSIRGFSDGQNEYTGVDYDWTGFLGGPSELRFALNSTGSILLGSSGNVLCYSGKVTGNSYVELSSRTAAYFKSSAAKTDTDQWTPLPCSISGSGKLSCTAAVNGVSFPQFAALSTHKLIPKSSNKLRLYKSGVTFTASTGATVNMYAAA
ncbi:hypothetical protein D6D29_09019 [Aureobasidium pullulans]|nr:hypothetical protein D6D29_09019 [Aureobasidium pullulans]